MLQSIRMRWKRWLAILAGVLALYALAGFWLAPLLIRHQLPRLGQAELQRQLSVGDVRVNPFTLRLEADDIRLSEGDGAPLLAVGGLAVEMQWRSIVRRAWSFAEIRVTAPAASLAIAPDGRFNLAQLLETLTRSPREDTRETGLPRVIVERFPLEQGRVDMRDRRAGYENTFAPIDFSLSHFSTLPEQNDTHTFTAESARGGKVRWRGTASVNPILASGEVTIENASLPELAVYLKSYTRARIAAGNLSATLPYTFAYADGKFEARLSGATVALRDLAVAREAAADSFAGITRLEVSGIDADLVRRQVNIGQARADGGKLSARREAKGALDLANLMIETAGPPAANGPAHGVAAGNWSVAIKQVNFDQLEFSAIDETVSPPLKVNAGKVGLQMAVVAQQTEAALQLKVSDAALSLADLTVSSGAQAPLKIARAGFAQGTVDMAARRASVGRLYAEGGQLQLVRDKEGKLNWLELLPRAAVAGAAGPEPAQVNPANEPWLVEAKLVELGKFAADISERGAGVDVHVSDLALKLEGASSDLKRKVTFDAGLNVREGGQLAAQGSVVPGTGQVQADVRAKQLALAPLQPLLAQHLKLKIAGGSLSAQGRLAAGPPSPKSAELSYVGSVTIAGLRLNELDGDLFGSWKNVAADRLSASVGPNRLDIPELRVVGADAKLIINDDRSFNALRLLVKPAITSPAVATPVKSAPDDPFPVRVRRLRFQDARLDFTDLSLRPQFAAKIYELNGVVNGLSSSRLARSQIELDGRVDEFGLARIRGELNPFAPRNNTDVNVVFKNVDMVPASPYSMKFAGYRIAEGKISLDLQYKIRDSKLEGANQIVIDKLTLGERVDSPDALKLPLQLAIAVLKDSDGRIDLGLPVTGDLSDPQFSYGAIIWKAITNVITKIITAPFRALGALLGVSGEKLESIDFDAGSAKLLPPEREKIRQVAQILAKRAQLKLSVPGQYSEDADGAALRARGVREEIARRAGIKLQAGEEPGPLDIGDRKVRGAIRDLYEARFGEAELDKQKAAAESAAAPAQTASAAGPKTADAKAQLPIWQRVGKMIQGEPQVADPAPFYAQLVERLNRNQSLPADALGKLGAARADAVLAALKDAGVDESRVVSAAPEKTEASPGKPVPLKLGLASR